LVGKVRRALVQESVHAFLLVLGGKQGMEQAALEHQAVGELAFKARFTASLAAITVICEKPLMMMAAPALLPSACPAAPRG
jgi:hypothetical protein